MRRNQKTLAILALLTGVIGVVAIAGLCDRSAIMATAPPDLAAPVTVEPTEVIAATPALTQIEPPTASRISVSFNDDTSPAAALVKGVPPLEKNYRRPAIDVWYGPYSEQDYPVLPASPFEKEPSRLNVKISFAF